MSKGITGTLTEQERTSRMQKLVSYLTTGVNWPLFTEEFEDDLTFNKTKQLWDAANAAVDIDQPITRQDANFTGAQLRDVKYAHAGRNFILKKGHHNAFRELYEGGKMAVDNEREWEDIA